MDDVWKLFPDIAEIVIAVFHIGVESKIGGGKDHGQSLGHRVTLDAGAPLPDGMIIRSAVKQIKHRDIRQAFAASLADSVGCLGQDHINLTLHPQRL